MAVFTKISKEQIDNLLNDYSIGKLISFEGILEGIENTNYKLITKKHKYILTIFEKRVNPKDLPFFMNLQKNLASQGFDCPLPIENNEGSAINEIAGKHTVIISFLKGDKIKNIFPIHCREVGSMIARFTNITKSIKHKRDNSMDLETCREIFETCKKSDNNNFINYFKILQEEFIYLKNNWPTNLPKAVIHADLFKDNIFFIKDKISGLIDFYFSCEDFIAYELALSVNAWCFDEKKGFQKDNYLSLIEGFKEYSSLTEEEENVFHILLRGAAVRILVTRLHDKIYHPDDALVIPKDPEEYLKILKWHQENKNLF